jgi:hypothetical protein
MRPALLVRRSFSVGGLILLTCVLAVPGAQQSSAYFPLGIDYPSDARTSASEIARDLQTVRSAGFNTIKTTISWREGEPVRGEYRLGALLRTLEVADRYGVRVILQIDRAEPGWVGTRYPDRQRTVEPSTFDCVEHPGVHEGDRAVPIAPHDRHRQPCAIRLVWPRRPRQGGASGAAGRGVHQQSHVAVVVAAESGG